MLMRRVISFFLIILAIPSGYAASNTLPPTDSSHSRVLSIQEFRSALKGTDGASLNSKEKRMLLRHQLTAIRKSNDLTPKQKLLLSIVTIAVFFGVLILLFKWAYNGGAGLWPGVMLVVAIFLLCHFLRRINRKKNHKNK